MPIESQMKCKIFKLNLLQIFVCKAWGEKLGWWDHVARRMMQGHKLRWLSKMKVD